LLYSLREERGIEAVRAGPGAGEGLEGRNTGPSSLQTTPIYRYEGVETGRYSR
jgi:hypothetical protein